MASGADIDKGAFAAEAKELIIRQRPGGLLQILLRQDPVRLSGVVRPFPAAVPDQRRGTPAGGSLPDGAPIGPVFIGTKQDGVSAAAQGILQNKPVRQLRHRQQVGTVKYAEAPGQQVLKAPLPEICTHLILVHAAEHVRVPIIQLVPLQLFREAGGMLQVQRPAGLDPVLDAQHGLIGNKGQGPQDVFPGRPAADDLFIVQWPDAPW